MKAGSLAVLFLSLLLGFSVAASSAPEFMDRPGTIVYALSLPIGSAVYLDAVYVDSISADHFTIREWWDRSHPLPVAMAPPPPHLRSAR